MTPSKEQLQRIADIAAKAGMPADQAEEVILRIAAALEKSPFPEGTALKRFLLCRWKSDFGIFRFVQFGWWKLKLSDM